MKTNNNKNYNKMDNIDEEEHICEHKYKNGEKNGYNYCKILSPLRTQTPFKTVSVRFL